MISLLLLAASKHQALMLDSSTIRRDSHWDKRSVGLSDEVDVRFKVQQFHSRDTLVVGIMADFISSSLLAHNEQQAELWPPETFLISRLGTSRRTPKLQDETLPFLWQNLTQTMLVCPPAVRLGSQSKFSVMLWIHLIQASESILAQHEGYNTALSCPLRTHY